jgi:hypothetical protein
LGAVDHVQLWRSAELSQSNRRGDPVVDDQPDVPVEDRQAKIKHAEKEIVLVMALLARKFQAWAALQDQPKYAVMHLAQEDPVTGQKTGCVLTTEALTNCVHLNARLAVGAIKLEREKHHDQILH